MAYKRYLVLSIVSLIILSLFVPLSVGVEEHTWPSGSYDSKNTGLSRYSTENNTGDIVWEANLSEGIGYLHSSPLIDSEDRIYVGTGAKELTVLSMEGDKIWNMTFDYNIQSMVLGQDDELYLAYYEVVCLIDTQTQSMVWEHNLTDIGAVTTGLTYDNGSVYYGTSSGNVVCLSSSGEVNWSYKTGSYIESTPVTGPDGNVYVGSNDDNLYGLDTEGNKLWDTPLGDDVQSPLIYEGTVYVGTFGETFYALNAGDGSQQWRYNHGSYMYSSPSLGPSGTIYINTYDSLKALNSDGINKWSHDVNSGGPSPVVGSEGTVHVFDSSMMNSEDNKIHSVYANGTERWTIDTNRSDRFSSGSIGPQGRIYVTSDSGILYAIGGEPDEGDDTGDDTGEENEDIGNTEDENQTEDNNQTEDDNQTDDDRSVPMDSVAIVLAFFSAVFLAKWKKDR